MAKKISSNLYTETKFCFNNKDGWHYEELEDGYLYSKMRHPTKIKKENLPDSFVYGRYYKNFGYLNSAGIKDLVYVPNYFFNHIHKDDVLYVSYNKPIDRYVDISYGYSRETYRDYDYLISGSYIIDFIEKALKYSDFDVVPIIEGLILKSEWFKEKYPDEIECQNIDTHIKYLKELLLRSKKDEKN